VSVTASRDGHGEWRWFLTRESGKRPRVGCRRHVGDENEDVRGAYMIMEFEPFVGSGYDATVPNWFVGRLERETVDLAARIADVFKQHQEQGTRCGGDAQLVSESAFDAACSLWFHGAMFGSGGAACVCSTKMLFSGYVCKSCLESPHCSRRMLSLGEFAGLYPFGRGHWWKGVTDAAGERGSRWTAGVVMNEVGSLEICHECVTAAACPHGDSVEETEWGCM
jgi:hypothetical protein